MNTIEPRAGVGNRQRRRPGTRQDGTRRQQRKGGHREWEREAPSITRAHADLFDVCERRELKTAISNQLLTRFGTRSNRGDIINGERLTVAGWDEEGNPIAKDGRSIIGRHLGHPYSATTYKCQGDTALKVILGLTET